MGKAPRIASILTFGSVLLAGVQGAASAQEPPVQGQSPGGVVFAPRKEVVQSVAPGAAVVRDGDSDSEAPSRWEAVRGQIITTASVDPAIESTIAQWRSLQQSDRLGFSAYANFLVANPGWPGESHFRDLAEGSADPGSIDPSQIVAFFDRYPPRSATGKARLAMALAGLGRRDAAQAVARDAWTSGVLRADDEQRLQAAFAAILTPQDHLRHADMALWARNPDAAERALAWVAPTRRPVIQARIAFQRRSADVSALVGPADPIGVSDAGYLADKARWLSASGDDAGARQLLATRSQLAAPVGDVEAWFELLLRQARSAGAAGDWSTAYAIASRVDDAFAPRTDVSDQPLGVRDDYTSLVWLAGTAALNRLGRSTDAIGLFRRYGDAARSPQTISKGYYWAGRAASAAGNASEANADFRRASAYPEQFYGQLALERLGQPIPAPADADRRIELSAAERQAFDGRTVVRAAKELGATGQWLDQSRLLRSIAASAVDDKEHVLVAQLAATLQRPDLGVMAGRRALSSGLSGYASSSFPRVQVPADHSFNWTMIHAIARQESQFDRQIVSHAGARGLMQLMPATAREVAGKIGVGYDATNLSDTQYNIRLGSTYFRELLDRFGGSYPLAVAAYNAGAGNVNKWLRANGDPRAPGGDMVQWIEDIPIFETKNYVQRVLENAVVYDLLSPAGGTASAIGRVTAPLSRYLGKQQPG